MYYDARFIWSSNDRTPSNIFEMLEEFLEVFASAQPGACLRRFTGSSEGGCSIYWIDRQFIWPGPTAEDHSLYKEATVRYGEIFHRSLWTRWDSSEFIGTDTTIGFWEGLVVSLWDPMQGSKSWMGGTGRCYKDVVLLDRTWYVSIRNYVEFEIGDYFVIYIFD